MLHKINIISLIIFIVFFGPIFSGLIKSYSREKILGSISSFVESIEFLISLLAAIYFTKKIFFENEDLIYKWIYDNIPQNIRLFLHGQDILTYLIFVPFISLILLVIFRPLSNLFFKYLVLPISDGIYKWISSMGRVSRRLIITISQLPRAIFILLIFGILLNFSTYYFYSPVLAKWMNESKPYQFLYKNALYPALNSNIAKKIPVIVNDSFKKTVGKVVPSRQGVDGFTKKGTGVGENSNQASNTKVIEYFNGVTLDEAVQSNAIIDAKAKEIVGNANDGRVKAQALYKWITKNIKYDYDKAERLSDNSSGISSGAIIAYNTRKGVCFDYSCLYIAMCRSVGINVRLITGLGYSGVSWGDHAWNQVYYAAEKRWINVDTTFGTNNNYFDKADFSVDHKFDEIQGEW